MDDITTRRRSTKNEVGARRWAIRTILEEMHPMTVRQVFYQATVRGIVEKTEAAYQKVQGDLAFLRTGRSLPFQWLTDSTRLQRKPATYSGPAAAIKRTAQVYRKAIWDEVDAYVEVWLEKDALAGVIVDETWDYDVPLMVSRGYSSWSFLHAAALHIEEVGKPAYIYHLGDFDPFGVEAANKIEEGLREHAPNSEIHFERLAVLPRQIAEWNLPSRPTKTGGSLTKRAERHGEVSVELDAIPPDALRQLVREAIERHIGEEVLERVRVAEASEREMLRGLVGMIERDGYFNGR